MNFATIPKRLSAGILKVEHFSPKLSVGRKTRQLPIPPNWLLSVLLNLYRKNRSLIGFDPPKCNISFAKLSVGIDGASGSISRSLSQVLSRGAIDPKFICKSFLVTPLKLDTLTIP